MLISHHEKNTINVLKQIVASKVQKNEILNGSLVNDLCEFTNEYRLIMKIRDFLTRRSEKGLRDSSSFYQSHWGKLSALHCMANANAEPPKTTHRTVLNWLKMLQNFFQNADEDMLDQKLSSFHDELGDTVDDLEFSFSRLLDTEDVLKARYRAIGMILHIIQDSFTVSHCERNKDTGFIEMFFCYGEQDKITHRRYDKIMEGFDNYSRSILTDVTTLLLNNKTVAFEKYFKLSPNAQPSQGGEEKFAKEQKDAHTIRKI